MAECETNVVQEKATSDNASQTTVQLLKSICPEDISADIVLDFLKHPDLSHELAVICRKKRIPVVSSGKKIDEDWALTPPT